MLAGVCVPVSPSGGAPELLSVLLEGESLFNDATSITLFEIVREEIAHPAEGQAGVLAQIIRVAGAVGWLMAGGVAVGVVAGYITS